MKKLIVLLLVMALALTLCACGNKADETSQAPAPGAAAPEAGPPPVRNTGTLSLLNMTEEEYNLFVEARRKAGGQMIQEGYAVPQNGGPGALPEGVPVGETEGPPPEEGNGNVIFYDTLDAMLMALNAGDIDSIDIYQSVARYLCATNDNLRMGVSYDTNGKRNAFVDLVQRGFNGNDFAFLMMETNAALRDEFNDAIAGMKADGTLDRLVKEQIDDVVDGREIKPIILPHFDGAETVKIAVTGSLPPMDYVAADGTPAGFNTAVLAEIGNRTGKNIELVVVDSIGRAAALASGAVDAVFWTRTSSESQNWAGMTEEQRKANRTETESGMTREEIELTNEILDSVDFSAYYTADMPEGTIATVPYFSDVFVPVELVR